MRFLVALVAMFVLAVTYPAWAEPEPGKWPEPLPKGVSPPFEWQAFSGYWRRRDDDSSMLYIKGDGLLDANIWKGGSVSYFVGRWKIVQEIKPPNARIIHEILMATDEVYCSPSTPKKPHRHFRVLEYILGRADKVLQIDYAINIDLPVDPLATPNDKLWLQFHNEARSSNYKMEGEWVRSSETEAPQWFRALVERTVARDKYDCE